jgi:hypothetical protein
VGFNGHAAPASAWKGPWREEPCRKLSEGSVAAPAAGHNGRDGLAALFRDADGFGGADVHGFLCAFLHLGGDGIRFHNGHILGALEQIGAEFHARLARNAFVRIDHYFHDIPPECIFPVVETIPTGMF